jgi:hypothetical protein
MGRSAGPRVRGLPRRGAGKPDGRKVTGSRTVVSRPAARPKEGGHTPACLHRTNWGGTIEPSRTGTSPSPHAVDLPPVPVLGGQGSNPPSTCIWGKFRTLLRLLPAWPEQLRPPEGPPRDRTGQSLSGRPAAGPARPVFPAGANLGGYLPSPQVLVLDEPTAGLSVVLTESVLADQGTCPGRPGACCAVTRAESPGPLRLADTASVLVRGQVVMSAPAAEVLASREVAEVFLGRRGRRPK